MGAEPEDPYRWLETDGPAVERWVRLQDDRARRQLSRLPMRTHLRRRFRELLAMPTPSPPQQAGKRCFHRERRVEQALAVLYVTEAGSPRPLIDPNDPARSDGPVLGGTYPSRDGAYLAYLWSETGNTRFSLRVIDVGTGKQLADAIPAGLCPVAQAHPGRNRVAWKPDDSGFYYTRRPASVPPGEERYHQKVYFHRLGDPWIDDELVFGAELEPARSPYPQLSPDGRHLLITLFDLSGEAPSSEILLMDLGKPGHPVISLLKRPGGLLDARFHRESVYLATRDDASAWCVARIALDAIGRGACRCVPVLAPRVDGPIREWLTVGDHLIVETVEAVSSHLRIYDLDGRFVREIDLPQPGAIESLHVDGAGRISFVHSSLVSPPRVHRLDPKSPTGIGTRRRDRPSIIDPFEIRQIRFRSRDGTRVPLYLVHKHGLDRNGLNPTVLYGYGGFGVSVMPAFDPRIVPFIEHGGVYAIANIRGGGELGEHWHRAGMRTARQNTFDDFIAAAEWLTGAGGYTSPSRLACFGWSNGGLLVNMVAVQRPDLWKAVVAGAPVADLARFHTADGGRHWIAEYGSPDEPDQLRDLLRYSPYHALPDRIEAPAILIYVPERDDRVAPWHGRKMAARWQAASTSNRPVLLLSEAGAGHQGRPARQPSIDRLADIWSFLFWQLEVDGAARAGPI